MTSLPTKVFLVTANIASCFDYPKAMLNTWLDEFFKVIRERDPQFVALHCQEVGGKNYETSMETVEQFLRNITNRASMLHFTRTRIFVDNDYTSAEKFTALGNLYFIRHDVQEAKMWDFKEKRFVEVEGKEEFVGDIEHISTKEKSKFPQQFFPECKWSRKGFLRTRWCLNGTQFDLVNIHLFHDASNFIAMEKFPSIYTLNRKRAMEYTLDRFHNDELESVPIFLFGDFNFRLDTGSVVQKLTEGCQIPEEIEVSGEKTREFKHSEEEKSVLSVSRKSFSHFDHFSIFTKDNGSWLRPFDKELSEFSPRLREFPINFPPSYPFEEGAESKEDGGSGGRYMKTRCPSWCDRVIINQSALDLIDQGNCEVKYDIIGLNARMGDHKPVGLCIQIPSGAGIIRCCSPLRPCVDFVHDPRNRCFTLVMWCRCEAYPICPHDVTPNNVHPPARTLNPLINNPPSESTVVIPSEGSPHSQPVFDDVDASQADYPPGSTDVLLKNLMRLNGNVHNDCCSCGESKGDDAQLKRVHSDPVKVKSHCQNLKGLHRPLHSNLVHSHSLDGEHEEKGPPSKLRLRSSSSRLISHHSSSSEEWFEEVPVSFKGDRKKVSNSSSPDQALETQMREEEPSETSLQPRVSSSSEDDSPSLGKDTIFQKRNFVPLDQNSLNNLLIPDNCSGSMDYTSDAKSMSNLSEGTDQSSVHKVSETNSNAHLPFNSKVDNALSVSDSNCVPVVDNEEPLSTKTTNQNEVEPDNSHRCCCAVS